MDILSEEQYQILGFIGACNGNFYDPTAKQVMLWRTDPEPTEAVYRTVHNRVGPPLGSLPINSAISRMVATVTSESLQPLRDLAASGALHNLGRVAQGASSTGVTTRRELVTPAETSVAHMVRLRWIEEVGPSDGGDPGLRLTDLGRALLRDGETTDDAEHDVGVVLLGKEDPLAYPTLVGQLAAAGAGLLTDPYLKLADIHTIVVSTQLTRLLVSGKPPNTNVLASMEVYLGNPSLARQVEVRSSTELHDRVLLADDGGVLTLGTSLNGVGRRTTVMTPIPSPARESLRAEYERLWSEADRVGPPLPADDGEGVVEGDDGTPEETQGEDAS